MIWYNKKIIVVHPPRTGGSSFETILRRNAVGPSLFRGLLFNLIEPLKLESPFRLATKHLRCSQVKAIVGAEFYEKATKIGFIRNPYDRVVSHYHFAPYREINSLSGKSLVHFIENYKPKPFEHGVTLDDYFDDSIDHFIRFEWYEKDVIELCENLMIQKIDVHETKTCRKKDWRLYYDDDSLGRVNEIYKNDFNRFGYEIL